MHTVGSPDGRRKGTKWLWSPWRRRRKSYGVLYVAIVLVAYMDYLDKLRQISFETKAPPGYTFISAGNPQVTNACKERCRREGLKILAVTVGLKLTRSYLWFPHTHWLTLLSDNSAYAYSQPVPTCTSYWNSLSKRNCCCRLSGNGSLCHHHRQGCAYLRCWQ